LSGGVKVASCPVLGYFKSAAEGEDKALQILYSANELRDAIHNVLANPEDGDRRVALVAYVSGHAQAFLPDANGLEIVCWLQPGSTDSLTLERLRKRGASIFKSERLHMKVYWSSRRGCVICSANVSGNALGGGIQKEAGVWLPPGTVDIKRLWEQAKPLPIESSDLKRLARKADRQQSRNFEPSNESPPDFLEWKSLSGRIDWKLGWWIEGGQFAKSAVTKARETYGVNGPFDFMNGKRGQFQPNDWVLQFKLPNISNVSWMHVNFVIQVHKSDKAAFAEYYPFQAVQATRIYSSRPPFILDKQFRDAFKKAITGWGTEKIEADETLRPSDKLLNLIAANIST